MSIDGLLSHGLIRVGVRIAQLGYLSFHSGESDEPFTGKTPSWSPLSLWVREDKKYSWTPSTSKLRSLATARPSSIPQIAVLQEQAKLWMEQQAPLYSLVTSQIVLTEAKRGSSEAADRRAAMLEAIPVLDENPDTVAVADQLIARSLIPEESRLDAMHVATAALASVQYLLTQNCRHIANAHVLPRVYRLLEELGLAGMLICTPAEFLGGDIDDKSNSQ